MALRSHIIANIRSMDLQNVFMIEDFYIDRLITSWCEHQAPGRLQVIFEI